MSGPITETPTSRARACVSGGYAQSTETTETTRPAPTLPTLSVIADTLQVVVGACRCAPLHGLSFLGLTAQHGLKHSDVPAQVIEADACRRQRDQGLANHLSPTTHGERVTGSSAALWFSHKVWRGEALSLCKVQVEGFR